MERSWKWINPFLVLIVSSVLFFSSPAPCDAAVVEYFYHPVFYSSVEEAYAAIRNMQNQFVGWQGTPAQNISLDRFGLRVAGALNYTTTEKVWVGGTFTGNWQDVQKPVHVDELTIIPFDRVLDMELTNYPDLNKENKWGVVCLLKGSNDPAAFRTPTKELAEILYNAIASLISASGHSLNLSRIGAHFRDITSDDLKSKEMKGMGLTEPKGMIVQYVLEESPGKAGGMLAGDVIVACNDQPVESYDQWARDIWPTATAFGFKVLKNDGTTTTRYVDPFPIDKLPRAPTSLSFPAASDTPSGPTVPEGQKAPKLGFSLRLPNDSENQAMKGKPGAVISAITPGGLAETARLQVGDILIECNGKAVQGPDGLGSLLVAKENTFTVMRKGAILKVKLAPEVSY